MNDPLTLFWVVLKATLLSTGGNGNLPALYDETVTRRGWLTPAQVAEAVGIGQVAPGPNGLWVVSLGYFIDGVRGGLLAALAVVLPPLLVLPLLHLYHRHREHPALDGFARGLALAVTGLGVVILFRLLAGDGGLTVRAALTAAAGYGLMATRRVPVPAILLLAALVGLLGP
jgi:chromate transporter